jgi:lipoprotein-anchoring transpeptidase ErfK/SrfK
MSGRMLRDASLGAVAAGAVLALGLAAAHAAPLRQAQGGPEIARLVIATPVRARPSTASPLVQVLAAVRPITQQQTALPVLRHEDDAAGDEWLLVRLPGRPVLSTGWIRSASTTLVRSPWLVAVDRAARRARVYRNGRLQMTFPVVVGKPSTPTPRGDYFVVEHVRQAPGSELGPWALATSAYSHVLQEFDGGPGQIALHGRAGALAQDPLGSAASHGCVRFANEAIRTLARLLPNGTPIVIR